MKLSKGQRAKGKGQRLFLEVETYHGTSLQLPPKMFVLKDGVLNP